jgi:hypothetical protein
MKTKNNLRGLALKMEIINSRADPASFVINGKWIVNPLVE